MLDMRFGLENDLTAIEIVNKFSEKKLSDLIFDLSQDPNSRINCQGNLC